MIDVQADWSGGIEALVEEANRWLARLLPADRASRPKDEVNPRLVRHYTTEGLLPAPRREGRDARYGRLHLVALLALRRLMADGLSGRALAGAVIGQDESVLERLALEGFLETEVGEGSGDGNEASRYLSSLFALHSATRTRATSRRSAASAPPPAVTPDSPPPPQKRISQTTRVEVRSELELQIGREFEWPKTERAWRALLEEIGATLRDVQRQQD